MSDEMQGHSAELFYVAPPEPPESRRPPLLTVGAIGWARRNLFHTWYDTVQTILTILFVLWFLYMFGSWALRDAQWNIVTNNLGKLMVGSRYPPNELLRPQIVAAIFIALIGITMAVYSRLSRRSLFIAALIVGVVLLTPAIANQLSSPPVRLLAQNEGSYSPLMFVADEGHHIEISVEPITDNELVQSEEPPYVGYIENNRSNKSIASRTRWNNDVKAPVAAGNLDLSLYYLTVEVRLLDSDGILIDSMTVAPGEDKRIELDLPKDDWYILETSSSSTPTLFAVDGIMLPRLPEAPGAAWVRLDGIVPFSPRLSASEDRLEKYGSLPDYDCPSSIECRVPLSELEMRFEGSRGLGSFFVVQLSPFFKAIIAVLVMVLVLFLAGRGMGYELMSQLGGQGVVTLTRRIVVIAWILAFPLSWFVLTGSNGVSPTDWGGLLLTVVLTFISVTVSLPIALMLALGRRSEMRVISYVSTGFIEVVRGVPLITILFMAQWVVPGIWTELRNKEFILMLVGLTIFTAAYTAEIVRGGLQIVPTGQYEAAKAVGLSGFHTSVFIVLPQAIRAVIPAIMGQFISIFKDTTLVSIVSIRLYELLRASRETIGADVYAPYKREIFLFIGIIYFIISYVMSVMSRRLEETGSGVTRRR